MLAFLFLQVSLAAAQTAVVTRNVNLRPDASTNNAPLAKLSPGTRLEILEPAQPNGFFHVKTTDGTEGWAWSKNLHVQTNGPLTVAEHIRPASLYPDSMMTPGLAATLIVDDLAKGYTENCPGSKPSCTYSQAHRNVPESVHKKVYDEYNVPQEQRNIKSGEVTTFIRCVRAVRTISQISGTNRQSTNGTERSLATTRKTSWRHWFAYRSRTANSTCTKRMIG